MIAAVDLVPSYDMLGLPIPAWIVQVLTALTLALHWSFLAATIGGTLAMVLGRVRRTGESTPLASAVAPALPFCLSMAMTLGIAPLLFAQVLYGHLFYTANILGAYVWLGLLILVVVNFYLLYHAWKRVRADRMPLRLLSAIVPVVFAAAAIILAANATLTQSPDAWPAMRASGGFAPYLGDATLHPRVCLALLAFLAGGGLFAAGYAQVRLAGQPQSAGPEVSRHLTISLLAMVGLLACGLWAAISLPSDLRDTLSRDWESLWVYLALLAFAAAAVLTVRARLAPSRGKVMWAGLAFFAGLLAMGGVRDLLRRLALARHYVLADVPVRHAQWDSFGLFAIVFLLGLGVIAWLVKLATSASYAPNRPGP